MSLSSFASVQLTPRQQYKVSYKGSFRRIVVDNEANTVSAGTGKLSDMKQIEDSHDSDEILFRPSIKNVKNKVLEEFPYLEGKRLVLEYIDDENESVCCDTDTGLLEALRCQYIDNELKGTCVLPRLYIKLLQEDEEKQPFSSKLINAFSTYSMWSLLVYLVIELLRNESIEVLLARNDLLLITLILGLFFLLMNLE